MIGLVYNFSKSTSINTQRKPPNKKGNKPTIFFYKSDHIYFLGNQGKKEFVFSTYSLYLGFVLCNVFSSKATPETFMIKNVIKIAPITCQYPPAAMLNSP